MYKKLLAGFMIFSCTFFVKADDCQMFNFSIEQNQCTVSMLQCQSAQKIRFKYCQTQQNHKNSKQRDCILKCCKEIVNDFNSSDNIQKCQGIAKETTPQFIVLLLYIFPPVAICLIVITLCLIRVLLECCLYKKRSNDIINQDVNIQRNTTQGVSQHQLIFSGQKWISQHQIINNKTILKPDENCTICLQSNTDIITQCKHNYHIDCLFTWLKKQNYCPLCHKTNLKNFSFFCHRCHKNYFDVNIFQQSYSIVLNQTKDYVCSKCKAIDQRQNSN